MTIAPIKSPVLEGAPALPKVPEGDEKDVAEAFEGMFVAALLKGMRQGTFATDDSFGKQTFNEMFDEQIAKQVAHQGLGIGDTLFAPSVRLRPQESGPAVDS